MKGDDADHDDDSEREEVADDERGNIVRRPYVFFVHDCNKLSLYRIICLTTESRVYFCQSFSQSFLMKKTALLVITF